MHEFYCSLGLVADFPAYADRPDCTSTQLAWAGTAGIASSSRGGGGSAEGPSARGSGEGSAGPSSPVSKKPKMG